MTAIASIDSSVMERVTGESESQPKTEAVSSPLIKVTSSTPESADFKDKLVKAREIDEKNTALYNDMSDEAREKLKRNAVGFLRHPSVKKTPIARRVNFLKSKRVPVAIMMEAFHAAGYEVIVTEHDGSNASDVNDRVSEKLVWDILSGKTFLPPRTDVPKRGTPPAPSPALPKPQEITMSSVPTAVQQHQPYPIQHYQHLPQQQQPQQRQQIPQYQDQQPITSQQMPNKQEHNKGVFGWLSQFGWKDYFIGATVSVAGAVGVAEAVKRWFPYELVPRGSVGNIRQNTASASSEHRRSHRHHGRGSRQLHQPQHLYTNTYDSEISNSPSTLRMPLPPVPTGTVPFSVQSPNSPPGCVATPSHAEQRAASTTSSSVADALHSSIPRPTMPTEGVIAAVPNELLSPSEKQTKASGEQQTEEQKKDGETAELIAKLRKEQLEMAAKCAKLRGETTKAMRQLERETALREASEKELVKMREEAEQKKNQDAEPNGKTETEDSTIIAQEKSMKDNMKNEPNQEDAGEAEEASSTDAQEKKNIDASGKALGVDDNENRQEEESSQQNQQMEAKGNEEHQDAKESTKKCL